MFLGSVSEDSRLAQQNSGEETPAGPGPAPSPPLNPALEGVLEGCCR